jgi:radical SAM/Cys-rich protein
MSTMEDTARKERAGEADSGVTEPFRLLLSRRGLDLLRAETTILQANLGLECNQACKHCHLEAGPDRTETMDRETMDEVAAYAERGRFQMVDITGGAPELHPDLTRLIERISPLGTRIMLRSNLSALAENEPEKLIEFFKKHRVHIVASLPAANRNQTDAQRGREVFDTSIDMLKRLNACGYGLDGSGLELNLVSNPAGAFLPPDQVQAERRFREQLWNNWSISFTRLFTFANVPLGRFRLWLVQSGNLNRYMQRLASGFNPCTLDGVMCKTLVSVGWDGYLYDCDFNLSLGLPLGGRWMHVSGMQGPPEPGAPISVGDHCYTCTAGSGFT